MQNKKITKATKTKKYYIEVILSTASHIAIVIYMNIEQVNITVVVIYTVSFNCFLGA